MGIGNRDNIYLKKEEELFKGSERKGKGQGLGLGLPLAPSNRKSSMICIVILARKGRKLSLQPPREG